MITLRSKAGYSIGGSIAFLTTDGEYDTEVVIDHHVIAVIEYKDKRPFRLYRIKGDGKGHKFYQTRRKNGYGIFSFIKDAEKIAVTRDELNAIADRVFMKEVEKMIDKKLTE